MADTNETIADIIAEMRRGTRLPGFWRSCDLNKILQYHADRLEAAHNRERGDCAKLREALEKIAHYDDDRYQMDDYGCADGHICADIARQALGIEGGANG